MAPEPSGMVIGAGLKALLAQLQDAVVLVDASGQILLTNRKEELPAPARSVDMAGLGNVFEILHPDGRPYDVDEWPVLRSIRAGEVVVDEEFFRLGPDGSSRSFSCRSAPIYSEQGQIVAAVLVARDVSEQRRSREQLAYLLPMLDHTEDAIVACDADWGVIAFNDAAERMFGWTAEEVLGQSPEFLGLGVNAAQRREIRRLLAHEGHWRGDGTVRRTNGSKVSIETTAVAIRDAAGEKTGYLGIHRDVTERKRAGEDFAYHASLLDNVEDGVIATDAVNFRITGWNRGAERIYGYSAKEALGRPAREVASYPGDRSRLELERELVETGRARIEFTARRRDGTPIEVELIAVAVKSTDGEITGYLGIHRDITDRKRADKQRAYHAGLLENLQDAVIATDAEFVLTAWNRGAEAMFSWTPDEALGHKVYELIGTDWTKAELTTRLQRLREGQPSRTEQMWHGKGGKPVYAESQVIALRADDERISGYLSIMRDTSERLRHRQELETAVREQGLLAGLSMRALHNGQLRPLFDDAVRLLADVLEVELSSIAEVEPDGQGLGWRAAFGWTDDEIADAPPSAAGPGSLPGYTIMAAGPVISEDVIADKRFEISPLFAKRAPVSAASVVIPGPQDPFGVLTVAARQRRSFEPKEIEFMQAVANVLGIGIERDRSEKRADAAREAERTRIARELHDEGLRELTDALGIAALARSSSAVQHDDRHWAALTVSLQRLDQQLRNAIYDLRLGTHEVRAFADLLDELVGLQAELAIDSHVRLHGGGRLLAGSLGRHGTEVLRIVREAVTNARLHSGATTITVDASASTADFLRIAISDDGDWPDREAEVASRRGTGLLGMLERSDGLGAVLRIEGRTEGGTTVSLALPLAEATG